MMQCPFPYFGIEKNTKKGGRAIPQPNKFGLGSPCPNLDELI